MCICTNAYIVQFYLLSNTIKTSKICLCNNRKRINYLHKHKYCTRWKFGFFSLWRFIFYISMFIAIVCVIVGIGVIFAVLERNYIAHCSRLSAKNCHNFRLCYTYSHSWVSNVRSHIHTFANTYIIYNFNSCKLHLIVFQKHSQYHK